MGIEQAFTAPQTDIIFVNKAANYAPYERKIAELEGTIRGYEKGIAELTAVAKKNKDIAEKNAAILRLFKSTLRELVATGHATRDEVESIMSTVKKRLPASEQELISKPIA